MNPIPELTPHLKQLRLSGILGSLEARNRQALDGKLAYTEFLSLLIQDEVARREQKANERGKRPGGRPPAPPTGGVRPTDQVNLTDPESRIMPRAGGGGFEQSYNAHAAVDTDSMLIVAARLTEAPVDARQIEPMLAQLAALPKTLGRVDTLIADAGFFSAANAQKCETAKVTPLIARRRDQHHRSWLDRLAEPPALPSDADALQRMLHRLQTPSGRALYGLRKQTMEPVFWIIKHAMRFRQFLLRGKRKVSGEWQLVALSYNLRRMANLAAAA